MNEPSETRNDQDTWVAAYLQQHPDFFLRRPDILSNLSIPHETGEAVSLIEHQIKVLRKQTDNYRQQLEELVAVARENDQLNRRLHRLTLAMIEAEDLQELLNTLQDELRTQFAADAVELKLF